jgi:hypothetical protein
MKTAIIGSAPDFEVEISNLYFSEGSMVAAKKLTLSKFSGSIGNVNL